MSVPPMGSKWLYSGCIDGDTPCQVGLWGVLAPGCWSPGPDVRGGSLREGPLSEGWPPFGGPALGRGRSRVVARGFFGIGKTLGLPGALGLSRVKLTGRFVFDMRHRRIFRAAFPSLSRKVRHWVERHHLSPLTSRFVTGMRRSLQQWTHASFVTGQRCSSQRWQTLVVLYSGTKVISK